jgi:hypothetical protein
MTGRRDIKGERETQPTMTTAAEHVLRSFEDLTESERHEVAAEILRRTLTRDFFPLDDEALTEIASLTFRALDEREAAHE